MGVREFFGKNPMTEGKRYDSGLFDREAEAEALAKNPELAAGKDMIASAIEGAIDEMDRAQEIMDALHRLPVYGVIRYEGEYYLKTPGGTSERIPVYINRLEKSTLALLKKLQETQECVDKLKVELEEAKKPVKRKSTKRKEK